MVNVFLDYKVELLFRGHPYHGMRRLLVLFKSNPLLFLPITSYYSHVSKWRVTGRGTQGCTENHSVPLPKHWYSGITCEHCHSVRLNPYELMKMKFIC